MIQRLLDKLPSFLWQWRIAVPDVSHIRTWQYVLLAFFTFFCCYFGLSSYAILDMNEGLYAEVAREMLITKHFIVPYLNGVPYLEKPPLLYWLIAFSYHIFGVNDFAARMVPSTITALTCLSWLYIGKKLDSPRMGWIASIVLFTSLVFIIIGRVVFFDMLLTFLVSNTLMALYFWHRERNKIYLYTSYIFLGLAILTKGFLALVLVTLIGTIFFWLVKAKKEDYRLLFDKKALILFLIIILPWHLIAMVLQPGFGWEYFINNQLLRFFNLRTPHDYHTGPLWYYIPRMIAYLLPWSLLLPFILPWPLKFKRPFDALKALLWTWFFVALIFFSLSGDKGEYYLVIAVPPLAYLIAEKIDTWFTQEKSGVLIAVFGLMCLLLTIAGVIALLFYSSTRADFVSAVDVNKIPYILTTPIILMVTVMIVYGIAGVYISCRQKQNPLIPFLLLASLIVPMLLFYLAVKERTQVFYSQISLANYVKAQYEHRAVYIYQDFEAISSFIFYNRESSPIIDTQSQDLYFASTRKENKEQFISMADFLAEARRKSVYVVILANKLPQFEKAAGKDTFCAVQRNGNVLLLSNATGDCKATIDINVGQQKEVDLNNLKKIQ